MTVPDEVSLFCWKRDIFYGVIVSIRTEVW